MLLIHKKIHTCRNSNSFAACVMALIYGSASFRYLVGFRGGLSDSAPSINSEWSNLLNKTLLAQVQMSTTGSMHVWTTPRHKWPLYTIQLHATRHQYYNDVKLNCSVILICISLRRAVMVDFRWCHRTLACQGTTTCMVL